MKPAEFPPIFKKLAIAYGHRLNDDADTLKVYFDILSDLPVELVQAAAVEFMASPAAFPPTPGQIRERAVKLVKRVNQVPSADEAWKEILEAPVDGYNQTSRPNTGPDSTVYPWIIERTPYQFSHPLVARVAKNLGWPKKFWTDSLVSDRSRFMNAYNYQLEDSTEVATSLPSVQEYVERGQADIKTITDGHRRAALDRGRGEHD